MAADDAAYTKLVGGSLPDDASAGDHLARAQALIRHSERRMAAGAIFVRTPDTLVLAQLHLALAEAKK